MSFSFIIIIIIIIKYCADYFKLINMTDQLK